MAFEFTDKNFKTEVLEYKGVVLVDFWAPWCGPCRMIGPIVEQLAEEYAGKVKIGKLNVDENGMVPSQYQVMSIPTLIIFKDGKVVDQMVGAHPKDEIMKRLEKQIAQ